MSSWNALMLLSVTALWTGMLGAVAYLAGRFPPRRPGGSPADAAGRGE
jgi:hypothetical protein